MTFKQWFTQEYDRDLEAHVKNAVHISMTQEERAQTKEFLMKYARLHPARTRTPERPSWFSWSLHPYPIITGLLIVVLGGSSAAAASLAQSALPGDLLYPVKVNVNEGVSAALATTPEKKAAVALSRAEERIKELAALENRGADTSLLQTSEDRVDEQVRIAEEKSLETGDTNGERGQREQRLVAVLRAHEQIINKNQVPIGGSLEPEASLEDVVAFSAQTVATDTASRTSAPASFVATDVREVSAVKKIARNVPVPLNTTKEQEKKSTSTPSKVLARQKKAAEQRVDALKKLILKLEKQSDAQALKSARLALESAQDFLVHGDEALNDNETEASFLLNKALSTAIDGREALSESKKSEENREREDSRRGGGGSSGGKHD